MANILVQYLHRTEKKTDIEAILLSWALNLVTVFLVFNISWWISGSVFVTIMYTLAAWTITLSMSIAYWLSWVFNRMKTDVRIKATFVSIILLMYIVGLFIVWSTIIYVMGLLL